jgi:hypothetical protein
MTDIDPAVYRTAADRIRKGGLIKGDYSDGQGNYCTLGAVGWPGTTYIQSIARAELLADLIGYTPELYDLKGAPAIVTHWNDAEERTAEDVITLLEQAAEKLEANR